MEIKLKEILTEPIESQDMANAIRLDTFQKEEMQSLIKSGREAAENYVKDNFSEKCYSLIFNKMTNEVIVPFNDFLSLEKVIFTKEDGSQLDVTNNYRAYTSQGIIKLKEEFDHGNMDEYEGLIFNVKIGKDPKQVPEKVKEAIRWFGVNVYFKQPASEWYESFKHLLREIRKTTV